MIRELNFCLLVFIFSPGSVLCYEPAVITQRTEAGSDVVLKCSLSPDPKLFSWMKDHQKVIVLYDAGIPENGGFLVQDETFKGRVSHFPEELKHGNASIIIRNSKVSDGGTYSCNFPRLQQHQQITHIRLDVVSSPKPTAMILNMTEGSAKLLCEVRGVFPQPQLQWKDSKGHLVLSDEPKVSESVVLHGGLDVSLQTTVTKSGTFQCVSTQEQIQRVSEAFIKLYIYGDFTLELWIMIRVAFGVMILMTLLALGSYLVRTEHETNETKTNKSTVKFSKASTQEEPPNEPERTSTNTTT